MAASYGGPTERLARAVLIIELSAIFPAVSMSRCARTASSSRNLPYLLSPIWRKGRSSDPVVGGREHVLLAVRADVVDLRVGARVSEEQQALVESERQAVRQL